MSDAIVRRVDDVFTEEALKANDGKTVPLTDKPGGAVIGEAKLKYDPEAKALTADFKVDDPDLAAFLKGTLPSIVKEKLMAHEILIKFRNAEEAAKVDPTRIGIVAGGSEDGLTVVVEPDIDGWDGVRDEVRNEILRSGLAAAGVYAEISDRPAGFSSVADG